MSSIPRVSLGSGGGRLVSVAALWLVCLVLPLVLPHRWP